MAEQFQSDTAPLHRLGDSLRQAGADLADLDQATGEAGRVVVAATRPPRRSGYMADHLTAGPAANGLAFLSTARYWTWVHWGAPRRNIKAHPFFLEALDRSTDEVLAVYAEHAQHALDKVTP